MAACTPRDKISWQSAQSGVCLTPSSSRSLYTARLCHRLAREFWGSEPRSCPGSSHRRSTPCHLAVLSLAPGRVLLLPIGMCATSLIARQLFQGRQLVIAHGNRCLSNSRRDLIWHGIFAPWLRQAPRSCSACVAQRGRSSSVCGLCVRSSHLCLHVADPLACAGQDAGVCGVLSLSCTTLQHSLSKQPAPLCPQQQSAKAR